MLGSSRTTDMDAKVFDEGDPTADIEEAHAMTARVLNNDQIWRDLFGNDNAGQQKRLEWGTAFWRKMVDVPECLTRKAFKTTNPSKILGVAAMVRILSKKTDTIVEGLGDRVWGDERLLDPPAGNLKATYYNWAAEYKGIDERILHLVALVAEGDDKGPVRDRLFDAVVGLAEALQGNIFVYCPVQQVEFFKRRECELMETKTFPKGGQRAFLIKVWRPSASTTPSSSGPIPSVEHLE